MSILDRLGGRFLDLLIRRYNRLTAAEAERRCERLAMLVMRIDKKHRERATKNLALAFPEKDDAWRKATMREMYLHFGRVGSDFLRAETREDADVVRTAEVIGREYLDEAIALGKGTLCCSGHFGNWERFVQWLAATGHPVSVIAREADQDSVQGRMTRLREAAGVQVLLRGSAAMEMVKRLRKGELVAMLPDQNDDECFVPFFGHPAGTVLGPAKIQSRGGTAILPFYCIRLGTDKYRIIFRPIISGQTPEETMTTLSRELETVVRAHPEQYLWMHDRWKLARRKGLLPAGSD